MVRLERARQYDLPSETIAVVVANALPLVGVVALGWNLTALVFLYWFELGILSFWALVRAVFAGRPSEFDADPLVGGAVARKRTAAPIPFTGLEIRLSTLPVLAVATPILAVVWFFAGVTTVGVIGPESPDSATLGMVVLASFGIFLSEGASTLVEYGYRQGYREHSAQTAIQGVFMRAAVIAVGGLLTATFVGFAADSVASDDPISAVEPTIVGPPMLVGIVLVKFGFDLAGLYRDRLAAFDEASYFDLGWAYEPPTVEPVEPLADVDQRLRPTRRGRLLGWCAARNLRRHPGALAVGGFCLLVAALFALGGAWDVVVALVGASLVVPAGLFAIDYWVRYAGVEYRVSDEAIVASDRLFRTRLWRVEPWDEQGVRVDRDRVDRWLGTATVVIECADRDLRLPHLADPGPVLDVFDRPVQRAQNDPARAGTAR